MQTAFGLWASKALLSAVEIRLFTKLANGPQEVDALIKRLKLHTRMALGISSMRSFPWAC